MREAKHRIDDVGARVIGVAAREAHQAQKLLDEGIPFDLLLDPDEYVRKAVGASERISPLRLLSPSGARAYSKALRQARFFNVTMSEATQRPGAVILDAQLNVTWSHIGDRLGDYPDIEVVLTELRRAV